MVMIVGFLILGAICTSILMLFGMPLPWAISIVIGLVIYSIVKGD